MQIFTILGLLLKFLPYVVPVLTGLFGALNNLKTAEEKDGSAQIDMDKLQLFIEAQTTKVITDVINKHKGELVAYVPSEEQAERDRRMDELMKELEKAQDEYNKSRPTTPPDQPVLEP